MVLQNLDLLILRLNIAYVGLSWQAETLFEQEEGYTIISHVGDGSKSVDWHRELNLSSSIQVCLNERGRAEVNVKGLRLKLDAERIGIYECFDDGVLSRRNRGYDHRFTTISLEKTYLQDQLAPSQFLLQPEVRRAIYDKVTEFPLCIGRLLAKRDQQWLLETHNSDSVPESGRALWTQSKILEFMAYHFFKKDGTQHEFFCQKVKRQDSDRVINTKIYLEKHFRESFCLDRLSRYVGCSSTYLSRLFSQETGMTLKLYLRSVRIREARKMLQSRKYNVTEAAFECGYNSLSHFTKVFKEELGYKPSDLK